MSTSPQTYAPRSLGLRLRKLCAFFHLGISIFPNYGWALRAGSRAGLPNGNGNVQVPRTVLDFLRPKSLLALQQTSKTGRLEAVDGSGNVIDLKEETQNRLRQKLIDICSWVALLVFR